MGKKETRLEVIKMLISSQELSKQEELMAELEKAGYATAQATLSRDLRLLGVVKVQNDTGRYVYMMPNSRAYRSVSDNHMTVMAMHRLGALGVKFSGNGEVSATLRTWPTTLTGPVSTVWWGLWPATTPCWLSSRKAPTTQGPWMPCHKFHQ